MLKELKAHHRNIIQMKFNGFKTKEIAERLGITEPTVSTILNSPLAKAYLAGLEDKAQKAALDVRKELISMNKDALNTFQRLLDPKAKIPAAVQFNTAKDILDRTGYKASDKIDINMTMQNKSDEEIEAEIAAMEGSIKGMASIKDDDSSYEDSETLVETPIEDNQPVLEEPKDKRLSDQIQDIIDESLTDKDKEFNPFKNIDE